MGLKRAEIILPVTLFYDGDCPLCMAEIHHLNNLNHDGNLILADIRHPSFREQHPGLDPEALDRFLHSRLGDGRMVTGVDATLAAWEAVGKGTWLAPLRWPLVSRVADRVYALFARNRHGLSRHYRSWTKKSACCSKQKKR